MLPIPSLQKIVNIKGACILHSILVGIRYWLVFDFGWCWGLLNGQNPLNVTKVIC